LLLGLLRGRVGRLLRLLPVRLLVLEGALGLWVQVLWEARGPAILLLLAVPTLPLTTLPIVIGRLVSATAAAPTPTPAALQHLQQLFAAGALLLLLAVTMD
jgi:hypothetical protein